MVRRWTDEEIHFLKFAYPNKDFTTKDISLALNRKVEAIYVKANELKLSKYKEELPLGHKRCTKCKSILPLSFFTKRKHGYDSWCNECYKVAKRKKEESFKEESFKEESLSKICTKCKELKNINDFYKDKTCIDGRLSYCKKCRNKQQEEYRVRKLKERGW